MAAQIARLEKEWTEDTEHIVTERVGEWSDERDRLLARIRELDDNITRLLWTWVR